MRASVKISCQRRKRVVSASVLHVLRVTYCEKADATARSTAVPTACISRAVLPQCSRYAASVSTHMCDLAVSMQFEAGWWWPKGDFGRLPLLTNVSVLAEFGVLGSGVATTTANGVAVNARRGCLSLESFV